MMWRICLIMIAKMIIYALFHYYGDNSIWGLEKVGRVKKNKVKKWWQVDYKNWKKVRHMVTEKNCTHFIIHIATFHWMVSKTGKYEMAFYELMK